MTIVMSMLSHVQTDCPSYQREYRFGVQECFPHFVQSNCVYDMNSAQLNQPAEQNMIMMMY